LSIDSLANNDTIKYVVNSHDEFIELSIDPYDNVCVEYYDFITTGIWADSINFTTLDYPVGDIDVSSIIITDDNENLVTVIDSVENEFMIDDVTPLQLTAMSIDLNQTWSDSGFVYNWAYYNPETDTLEQILLENANDSVSLYKNPLPIKLNTIQLDIAYAEYKEGQYGYCKSSVQATVLNNFVTFIPNAFSPNEDGVFDAWVIRNIDKHPEAAVEIYNRWGALVFEGPANLEGWSGQTTDGDDLPMGTYFYILKKSPESEGIAGSVTIMK
jgi:gliding motility-associated-like protein